MNKHNDKSDRRGSSQQAPNTPKGDPKQQPQDAATQDDCAPAQESVAEPKDTPKQAPTGDTKQARPSPTEQVPLDVYAKQSGLAEQRPRTEPGTKQSQTDELLLEVVLRSYTLVLRDMTALAQRLDEIEMALGHVATRTYAPSHPRVRDALACVRSRAQTCITETRPPETSIPMTPPQTVVPESARGPNSFARTRELGERVLAAAAHAREQRDEADRLTASRAPAEEIAEAIRVAEQAEAEAFATAEEANAELLG